jgi:hypothetical protein
MKSVIVEGPNDVKIALGWTENPATPILTIADLAPHHPNTARVVFANDFDADAALTTRGPGWVVLHDSFPKYGFEGTVVYVHPEAPIQAKVA